MIRKERKNSFIERSKIKHNNFYTYDNVVYVNNKTEVMITCPNHGNFSQIPNSHLKGHGCRKCSNEKRKLNNDLDKLLIKMNKIHDNKYEYPNLTFNKNDDIIKIICPNHGEFSQRLSDHLSEHGCPVCGGTKPHTKESFTKEAYIIHDNFYGYKNVIYVDNKTVVKITCPKHGDFPQTPNSHLSGHGCPICINRKSNQEEYIKKAKITHNDYYSYNNLIYNGSDKYVIITCPEHGDFSQRAAGHLQGFGCGKCNKSKGEREIEKYLFKNNIKYVCQKKFNDCKNIHHLKFDFYLPDYNLCVEYDGEYHYKKIFENNNLEKQKLRDKIKDDYCKNNNIHLLRIPYYKFNHIKKILDSHINKIN